MPKRNCGENSERGLIFWDKLPLLMEGNPPCPKCGFPHMDTAWREDLEKKVWTDESWYCMACYYFEPLGEESLARAALIRKKIMSDAGMIRSRVGEACRMVCDEIDATDSPIVMPFRRIKKFINSAGRVVVDINVRWERGGL